MSNAVCIGYGTVGKATANAFAIDKYYSRSDRNIELPEVAKCKYIFICLPTPTEKGKFYVADIHETIKEIIRYPESKNSIFIIRSTVFPGFNRVLQQSLRIKNIVSNPEFLSEDTAFEDAKQPDLVVIGADNFTVREEIVALYKGRFKYTEYVITDSITAELIKLSLNTFFSLKVIYANVLHDYAQKIGANYETIKGTMEFHKWGSKNHWKVFYKGKKGLYGKCLPKDLEAFSYEVRSKTASSFLVWANEEKKFINEEKEGE